MSTPIEDFLYQHQWAHFVFEFTLGWKRLVLKLVTQQQIEQECAMLTPVVAEFDDVTMTGADFSYCTAGDLNLPWDIIGFDCKSNLGDRWEFVLHTCGGEYCFEASWPRLVGDGSTMERSGE